MAATAAADSSEQLQAGRAKDSCNNAANKTPAGALNDAPAESNQQQTARDVDERNGSASKKQSKKVNGKGGKSKSNMKTTTASQAKEQQQTKPRSLVEELKLFQNNHLLNQQDPLERLQHQLSQLAKDDDNAMRPPMQATFQPTLLPNGSSINDGCLSMQTSQSEGTPQQLPPLANYANHGDAILTLKKGVLWQLQNYDKFHQRLFNRWKKRYFILTTDYLVCFKRTSSKVGHSEMGEFLYKTALSDVTKIAWLRPKKSDKGAIILHFNKPFTLFLWTKRNLEDWMFMIHESVERIKVRRSCLVQNCSSNSCAQTRSVEHKLAGAQENYPANDADRTAATEAGEIYENTGAFMMSQQNFDSRERSQVNGTGSPLKTFDGNAIAKTTFAEGINSAKQLNDSEPTITIEHSSARHLSSIKSRSPSKQTSTKGVDVKDNGNHNQCAESIPQADNEPREAGAKSASSLSSSSTATATPKSTPSVSRNDKARGLIERVAGKEDFDPSQAAKGGRANNNNSDGGANRSSAKKVRKPIMINDVSPDARAGQSVKGNARCTVSSDSNNNMVDASSPSSSSSSSTAHSERAANDDLSSENCVRPVATKTIKAHNSTLEQVSPPLNPKNNIVNKGVSGRADKGLSSANKETPQIPANKSERPAREPKEERERKRCNSNKGPKSEVLCDSERDGPSGLQLDGTESCGSNTTGQQIAPDKQAKASSAAITNLIRRDDSWQSLVSLTRIGKVPPVSMQAAQRSLYAQHIMPASGEEGNGGNSDGRSQFSRQHGINILESTVTPSRGPMLRQLSVQAHQSSQRKLRPLGQFGGAERTQAVSLDVPPTHSQSVLSGPLPGAVFSYQQKLLQLQLLHNSNNVDYIRQHEGNGATSDYQIYGPEGAAAAAGAATSSHYGYSSMHSNLKSAASEFSFIRPMATGYPGQSTLPRHPYVLDNQDTRQPMRSSLVLGPGKQALSQKQFADTKASNNDSQLTDYLASQASKQFLVNPMTGERIINQQLAGDANGNGQLVRLDGPSELAPPMRELPMRPNKKRLANDSDPKAGSSNLPKSSSLTSSIAYFFRRAFSRRSKRKSKNRSKLAESCSSSLGAFEDNFANVVPALPSAFSTGSKSIDGRNNREGDNEQQRRQQQQRPQKMVDMIEAFANRTGATNHSNGEPSRELSARFHQQQQQQQQRFQQPANESLRRSAAGFSMDFNHTPKMTPKISGPVRAAESQFGSPLHKSNSISATMGLSLADNRRAFLYDNVLMASGGNAANLGAGGSPMLMRSAKVMSANLTPFMLQHNRGDVSQAPIDHKQQLQLQHNQAFMSPRNSRGDQIPRPSSIYGQPSLISSPIIAREDENNFGALRSSMHNPHHQFSAGGRDRNLSSNFDLRRHHNQHHQLVKMTGLSLDTTREVAEELPSPTSDLKGLQAHHYSQNLAGFTRDQFLSQKPSGSRYLPSSPRETINSEQQPQHHNDRRAIVNPTLQSSNLDTIYDNHPMLNGPPETSYSHYDNHNQLLIDRHQPSPSMIQVSSSGRAIDGNQLAGNYTTSAINDFAPNPINRNDFQLEEGPYMRNMVGINIGLDSTPSRRHRDQIREEVERSPGMVMVSAANRKPAAIVAPSTPNRASCFGNEFNVTNQHAGAYVSAQKAMLSSRSPVVSRRMANNGDSPHYQQSAFVCNMQTRLLNKGDGVQASVIGGIQRNQQAGVQSRMSSQPVINIAGAPGINLDPALAASLLRGTNIDAYETSTFERLAPASESMSNSKTFLVATRLSKSMAYTHSPSSSPPSLTTTTTSQNNGSDSSSQLKDDVGGAVTALASKMAKSQRASSKEDELSSSSSSRSVNPSLRRSSSQAKSPKFGVKQQSDSREDKLEASPASSDTHRNSNATNSQKSSRKAQHSRRSSSTATAATNSKRRQSSSEPSDDLVSLDRPDDEKNWITSKLVE